MKENGWQHFCEIGSINEYLRYRAETDAELSKTLQRHGIARITEEDVIDAGIYRGNRDCFKEHADGRI